MICFHDKSYCLKEEVCDSICNRKLSEKDVEEINITKLPVCYGDFSLTCENYKLNNLKLLETIKKNFTIIDQTEEFLEFLTSEPLLSDFLISNYFLINGYFPKDTQITLCFMNEYDVIWFPALDIIMSSETASDEELRVSLNNLLVWWGNAMEENKTLLGAVDITFSLDFRNTDEPFDDVSEY